MSNPFIDSLFRPTTLSPTDASAAPVRVTGTRMRAGNAMSRTRTALLSGAAASVEASGTKIAMSQVAAAAGVAKATLYNHFRTREAVLAGLVVSQVTALVDEAAGKPLEVALADTAMAIARNPVRRGLARIEPGVLAELGRVDDRAEGWQRARAGVAAVLAVECRGGTDTVLRWLASFVVSPGDRASIAADVSILMAGLPVVAAEESTALESGAIGPGASASARSA